MKDLIRNDQIFENTNPQSRGGDQRSTLFFYLFHPAYFPSNRANLTTTLVVTEKFIRTSLVPCYLRMNFAQDLVSPCRVFVQDYVISALIILRYKY